jgi:hypothetical protein
VQGLPWKYLKLKKCLKELGTKAAKTAQQMVVVARKDFGKKAPIQYRFLKSHMVISQILNTLKEKNCTELLSKIVPTLYLILLEYWGNKIYFFKAIGIFKPIYREETK